jgi:hypothetical protein
MHRLTMLWTAAALIAAGAGISVPPPAHALDLTGTWEGSITCTGLAADGERDRYRVLPAVEITQTGADTFNLRETGADLFYFGRAIAKASNPDAGVATYVGCPTDASLPPDSEMVHVKVSADPDPASVAGTLRGSGPFVDADTDGLYSCKWTYRRVSKADPGVPACQ